MAYRVALAGLCLLGSMNAGAGEWSVAPDPATIGTAAGSVSQTITIAFAGDGVTQHTQIDYDFPEALFTAHPSPMNGSACLVFTPNANHRVRVVTSMALGLPTTPTALCSVTFTSLQPLTDTGAAAEFTFPTGGLACGDPGGAATPCGAGNAIRLDVGQPLQIPPRAVPVLGSRGKGITIALVAGLGLLGFSLRRRLA